MHAWCKQGHIIYIESMQGMEYKIYAGHNMHVETIVYTLLIEMLWSPIISSKFPFSYMTQVSVVRSFVIGCHSMPYQTPSDQLPSEMQWLETQSSEAPLWKHHCESSYCCGRAVVGAPSGESAIKGVLFFRSHSMRPLCFVFPDEALCVAFPCSRHPCVDKVSSSLQ